MEDFNPIRLATEELEFKQKLCLKPSGWVFGCGAFSEIAPSGMVLRDLAHVGFFLGLPVTVDPDANPWTVKLITEE
jgi:hypothetical protein